MVGCSGRRRIIRLAQKIATLALPLALLFPLASIAQTPAQDLLDSSTALGGGMLLGGGVSSNVVDPCANATDKESCRKKMIANRAGQIQSEPESSLPPPRTPPKAVTAQTPVEPSEFQEFVAASIGKKLPMYGYDLFNDVPDTFAPVENIPVTPDYLIGPGDEIVIKGWGQIDINIHAMVNRNGEIDLPKVGSVNVAGVRYQDLQGYLKNAIGQVFRNFDLNVTLGKLRSIQVFVVGQAKRPGVYTVSSLSTLVNTLFASGGPSVKGSMRQIEVKRNNKIITTFDLYDLIIKGDKSRDVKLLPGDVIYIPPIGRQAAISGSVNVPAIYELKEGSSFSDLLALAGGVTNVAAMQKASVEQILDNKLRKVDEIQFDDAGLARKLQNGDVITVFPILQRFDNAVKLQGHVANPIRHVWQKGMRVTDLLGGRDALIPRAYWEKQNSGALSGKYSNKEVNWDYAVIQRLDEATLTTKLFAFNLGKAIQGDPVENELLQPGDVVTIFSADESLPKTENDVALKGSIFPSSMRRFVWREGMKISNLIPDAKWLIDYYDYWLNIGSGKNNTDAVSGKNNTGAVSAKNNTGLNWEYANIVRLQAHDLSRTMITFDLGKVVLEKDSANDMALLPGDEISIFTNNEIQVPADKKKRYVRMEGEFKHGGVYEVLPGETLRQLVARIGGLTPKAYLFGAEFTRESVRVMQQQKLQEMIDRMEEAVNRNLVSKEQAALSKDEVESSENQAAAQAALIARMRKTQATGRVVLEIPSAESAQMKDLPDMVLDDGDRLVVPTKPSVVNVMGMVYNENAFIYRPGKSVGEYIDQAGGPTRDADESRMYVLRADGSVVSAQSSNSIFSAFSGGMLMPGDAVVVPEMLDKFSFTKELRDWSQIFYQFALGVAGLKVLRM